MGGSGGDSELVVAVQGAGDVPGRQLLDAVDRLPGDVLDDVAQIRFRGEAVELGRPMRLYMVAARSPPAAPRRSKDRSI